MWGTDWTVRHHRSCQKIHKIYYYYWRWHNLTIKTIQSRNNNIKYLRIIFMFLHLWWTVCRVRTVCAQAPFSAFIKNVLDLWEELCLAKLRSAYFFFLVSSYVTDAIASSPMCVCFFFCSPFFFFSTTISIYSRSMHTRSTSTSALALICAYAWWPRLFTFDVAVQCDDI